MVLRKTLLSLTALGALACTGLVSAQAQTAQLSFTGGVFDFSGSTFSGSGSVVFNYYTVNGVQTAFPTPFHATIALSGTAGTATEATVGGTQVGVSTTLTNVSETITAAQSGFGFTTGEKLVGFTGGTATLGGAGSTISLGLSTPSSLFTSDVFALAGPENTTLQLSPSSVLSVTGSTTNYGSGVAVTTGSLNAFTATGKSNVFNAASVPEASTMIGLGGLVLGGGLLGLRRRKA